MSMSSRFAVAVHVMALLALAVDEPTTSEYVAGSVNTNPVVVRRIVGALREADLVTMQFGAGGGARLARQPEQITLRDVYKAVEDGNLFSLHHRQPNPVCVVGANIQDSLENIFDQAEAAMEKVLAEVTVAQVLHKVMMRAGQPIEP